MLIHFHLKRKVKDTKNIRLKYYNYSLLLTVKQNSGIQMY